MNNHPNKNYYQSRLELIEKSRWSKATELVFEYIEMCLSYYHQYSILWNKAWPDFIDYQVDEVYPVTETLDKIINKAISLNCYESCYVIDFIDDGFCDRNISAKKIL